jgi:hypothetical protein
MDNMDRQPYIQYDQYVLETITRSPGLHRVDESKL